VTRPDTCIWLWPRNVDWIGFRTGRWGQNLHSRAKKELLEEAVYWGDSWCVF